MKAHFKKYMKKYITVAVAFVSLVAVFAACWVLDHADNVAADAEREIDVLGHTVKENAFEIVFSGDEITDISVLKENLGKLYNLKRVDLGGFHMFDDELEALKAEFPNVEFECVTYKKIAGSVVLADAEEIDLEGAEYDFELLLSELAELKNLKKASFGNDSLSEKNWSKLKAEFPDVEFVAVLTYPVSGKDFREDATEIDISGAPIEGDLTEALTKFEALELVELQGAGIDVKKMIELKKAFPNVIFVGETELGGEAFSTEVEEIDFNSKKVGDFELFFDTMALFNKLTKVEMCDSGFTNEQMEKLRDAYPNTKFVWRVYMGKWSLRTDAIAFSVLIMDYTHKRLTNDDIQVLKYCTELQALDIGHQAVSDLSVIGDYLTELRVLILADNRITDLSPLSKLKRLHYLEFFVNQVSDLSPLAECRELVDLNISYNYRISDITPLLDLPLLERLWLEHVAVPYASVNLLRETYPNAKIVSVGEGSVDQGWRTHSRYWAMMNMYHNNYISEYFSKYDGKT